MQLRKNRKRKRIGDNFIFVLIMLIIVGAAGFEAGRLTAPKSLQEDSGKSVISKKDAAGEEKTMADSSKAVAQPDSTLDRAADIVSKMTLEEKIYQMIFTTPESLTGVSTVIQAGDSTKEALAQKPIGGIIYFSTNIQNREQIKKMIKNSQEYSKIPLFIGVDEEGGRVARITGNAALGYEPIPAMAQIGASGDEKKAYIVGKQIADILVSLGFNVDFAPVADIITNPNNTEIGDRSFGNDPELTANMVSQEVLGLQDEGICSVLKHFPGHGSTQANSHNGYSESTRTLTEMRKSEFVPFSAGIEAGADFVLVSHMSAINVDSTDKPSSLSGIVVSDILKNELGFKGLVITDSLSMGAVSQRYSAGQAAVMAVEAGVDVLLIPSSLTDAASGLKDAIKNGKISEEMINERVKKIINLKIKRGILN